MADPKAGKILKFRWELDREGRTVLQPLTAQDQVEIEQALTNPKGITFGPTLQDIQACPHDPDIPFGISACGLEAESDDARARVRRLAREEWGAGNRQLAQRMLDTLDEEYSTESTS